MSLKKIIDNLFGIFAAKNDRERNLHKSEMILAIGDFYTNYLEPDSEMSLNRYVEHLITLYKRIYDAAEIDKQSDLSEKEISHEQNYYKTIFKITEFHGFWIAERTIRYGDDEILFKTDFKKLPSDKKKKVREIDDVIAKIKEEDRQKKYVDNLNKYPEKFVSFANLRKNTINSVYNSRENPRLMSDEFYNFLINGKI